MAGKKPLTEAQKREYLKNDDHPEPWFMHSDELRPQKPKAKKPAAKKPKK